ncbi:MAG: DUF4286 family protein [Cyclobacteriaceae bacterium]|nr:DUF4286 family protein [Cyclobacteriaceae bacterium]
MILYNVTVSVDPSIANEWLKWMKTSHIPEVLATGLFDSNQLYKVLLQEEDSITYSVQYFTTSMARLQQYHAKYAQELQAKHVNKFGDKAVAFRTVLETV